MSATGGSVPSTEGNIGGEPPFAHHGRAGEYFPVFLRNLLLNILTLGFYRFWARTNNRRYLWSRTRLFDEPFEYTGNGIELFVGFIFAVVVIILPLALLSQTFAFVLEDKIVGLVLAYLVAIVFFGCLPGVALYQARRYRMARTLWRGIRFDQGGNAWRYGLTLLALWLGKVMTFGLLTPFANTWAERYRLNNTRYGNQSFDFDGEAGDLFGHYILAWILSAFTLGLSMLFYKRRELIYFAARTRFKTLRFRLEPTRWQFFGLWFGNLMLTLFTLGIAYPFVQVRIARFVGRHLSLFGEIDLDDIEQPASDVPLSGEGMAEIFDVGTV